MISTLVCVGSLSFGDGTYICIMCVFTSHFVPRAAGSEPCTCKPVIVATSVRYRIAISGLAHNVSNKPQDNKHMPRWSRNVEKRRTHRWCQATKWRWSIVVAGKLLASQHSDIVLLEHKVQDLGEFPTSTPDTPKQDF